MYIFSSLLYFKISLTLCLCIWDRQGIGNKNRNVHLRSDRITFSFGFFIEDCSSKEYLYWPVSVANEMVSEVRFNK